MSGALVVTLLEGVRREKGECGEAERYTEVGGSHGPGGG